MLVISFAHAAIISLVSYGPVIDAARDYAGGTTEAMQRLNGAYAALKARVGA